MGFIEPLYKRSRVVSAGRRVREGRQTPEDLAVIDNWRACHAYVLNTFQANLRQRSRHKSIVVAQRLKRRHTIFDKLRREPHMQLAYMHDIAGCRLIFDSIPELESFRASLHTSRAKHSLRMEDADQYNYIIHPKPSGYRGVHDVYRYEVSSQQGTKWNGLLIEIQYRTKPQHAWATAVEVADLVTTNRIKFGDSEQHMMEFFRLSSEMIARTQEQTTSCYPTLTDSALINSFNHINRQTNLLRTFQNLQSEQANSIFRMNVILIYDLTTDVLGSRLDVETYDNINEAIERYQRLEKEREGVADIVLVRAADEYNVRDAYRNYFSDVKDFLRYIEEARSRLRQFPVRKKLRFST